MLIDPAPLRPHYPRSVAVTRHTLAHHPLLQLEAIVALATRMRPSDVEYNRGNLPLAIDHGDVPGNGLTIAETLQGIERNGSWMALKNVEQDAAYRALLDACIESIAPVIAIATGKALRREAFIFVSSPGSVTPLHFDPEHNVLLQLRGSKRVQVYADPDHRLVSPELHEDFHAGLRHRNLPWTSAFDEPGHVIELTPGDALHIPLMTPHLVRNGPEVSISLSITWRSAHSFLLADAHGFNALVRRAGFSPRPPEAFPGRNATKAYAFRAMRRLASLARRAPSA